MVRSIKSAESDFKRLRPIAVDALLSGAAFTPDSERLQEFTDEKGPPPTDEQFAYAAEYIGRFLTEGGLPNISHVRVTAPNAHTLRIGITRIVRGRQLADVREYRYKRRRLRGLPTV